MSASAFAEAKCTLKDIRLIPGIDPLSGNPIVIEALSADVEVINDIPFSENDSITMYWQKTNNNSGVTSPKQPMGKVCSDTTGTLFKITTTMPGSSTEINQDSTIKQDSTYSCTAEVLQNDTYCLPRPPRDDDRN